MKIPVAAHGDDRSLLDEEVSLKDQEIMIPLVIGLLFGFPVMEIRALAFNPVILAIILRSRTCGLSDHASAKYWKSQDK